MAKKDPIDSWVGGPLRVFQHDSTGNRIEITDESKSYTPVGHGWAVPSGPLHVTFTPEYFPGHPDHPAWPHVPGLANVQIEWEVRDKRLQCVGIRSRRDDETGYGQDGPELTSDVLRKLGPAIREWSRATFILFAVRLMVLEDGTLAGEAGRRPNPEGEDITVEQLRPDAADVYDHGTGRPRPGRRPLSQEHLQRVADLYREAAVRRQPRREFIASKFPGYSSATIGNWIRKARERGILGASPGPRIAGEQDSTDHEAKKPRRRSKGENDG